MNKLIAIFLCLTLAACSTTEEIPVLKERTDLGLQQSSPLILDNVQFKVYEQDNVTYVAMTLDNFDKLAVDFENIQDRLQLDTMIIKLQEQYYNAPLVTPVKK
jgi:hypothetical protein